MKMITAIVNKEDAKSVTRALIEEGFSITRLSTTGDYLMAGNVTLLIGQEEKGKETFLIGNDKLYLHTKSSFSSSK